MERGERCRERERERIESYWDKKSEKGEKSEREKRERERQRKREIQRERKSDRESLL